MELLSWNKLFISSQPGTILTCCADHCSSAYSVTAPSGPNDSSSREMFRLSPAAGLMSQQLGRHSETKHVKYMSWSITVAGGALCLLAVNRFLCFVAESLLRGSHTGHACHTEVLLHQSHIFSAETLTEAT